MLLILKYIACKMIVADWDHKNMLLNILQGLALNEGGFAFAHFSVYFEIFIYKILQVHQHQKSYSLCLNCQHL